MMNIRAEKRPSHIFTQLNHQKQLRCKGDDVKGRNIIIGQVNKVRERGKQIFTCFHHKDGCRIVSFTFVFALEAGPHEKGHARIEQSNKRYFSLFLSLSLSQPSTKAVFFGEFFFVLLPCALLNHLQQLHVRERERERKLCGHGKRSHLQWLDRCVLSEASSCI